MLTLTITGAAVAAFLLMLMHVIYSMKPKKLKFTAGVGKFFSLAVEADPTDHPAKLPTDQEAEMTTFHSRGETQQQ